MRILGLVFASSPTERRPEMTQFVAETLGLERIQVGGATADMFGLPDGSYLAVADPRAVGDTSR